MTRKIQGKHINKKGSLKNYILMSICGVLVILSVAMTVETATSGLEIASFEKTEGSLIDTKRDLEETLVKTLSSRELRQKSEELGFTKPEDLVYITQILPVAKLP